MSSMKELGETDYKMLTYAGRREKVWRTSKRLKLDVKTLDELFNGLQPQKYGQSSLQGIHTFFETVTGTM